MRIIDINDIEVRVFDDDTLVASSPGYVTADGKTPIVGVESARQAKVRPLDTESRFWERLSRDVLERPSRIAKYQADLAYIHLEHLLQSLKSSEDTVFSIPGDWNRDQVALLLGIAKALRIPTRAAVDAGLAAAIKAAPGRVLLHLDLHLHRTILTELSQGPSLERVRVMTEPNVGLLRVHDAWAHEIAARFVSHTRFDPMDHAVTEQALFDQLGQWTDALTHEEEIPLSLNHAGKSFESTLRRAELIQSARAHLVSLVTLVADTLDDRGAACLLLSDRAAAIPGLRSAMEEIPQCEVRTLEPCDTARGARRILIERGDDSTIPYIIKKPWLSRTELERHQAAVQSGARPVATHWLHAGVAQPLTSGGLALNGNRSVRFAQENTQVSIADQPPRISPAGNHTLTFNGKTLQSEQPLFAGDRLRWPDGQEVAFIMVEHDGATTH